MLSRMRYFKSIIFSLFKRSFRPINLIVGVILCHISPKAFPKDCCFCGAYQWFKLSLYHLDGRNFSSRRCYQLYYLFRSGRISPQVLRCLHKPTRIISFCCWFSNNSLQFFFARVLSKFFCGRSWHFLLHLLFQWSFFYSFFWRHGDVALFTHNLELWGSCSFHAYPFNRSVVPSAQVLFILSSFVSLFNRSAARICSSLFLFPNRVFSTSIISVVFFLSSCSTFQGSLVSLVFTGSNLVLPLPFHLRFSPVPS